jgi:hypothetical protein
MVGDPSNLSLASLALAGLGALVIAPSGSVLTVRQQLYFGVPLVAGLIAVAEFAGVGALLGDAALLLSFIVSVGLRTRVVPSRRSRGISPRARRRRG